MVIREEFVVNEVPTRILVSILLVPCNKPSNSPWTRCGVNALSKTDS